MSLRIAQIAPLVSGPPPASCGGTELMVHLFTEELVRRGHDVTLFAPGETLTEARLGAAVERIAAMAQGCASHHAAVAAAVEREGRSS